MQIHYPDQNEIQGRLAELRKWLEESAHTPAEEMQNFFSNRIDIYESVHLSQWAEEYHDFAGLVPNSTKTLLDLGCGTGLELDEIFRLHPDLQVTGIDLTKSYLDKLKEKHPDKALRLIEADYTVYPFENERYDCVISFMTLHHFFYEKKGQIYRKIYESLAEGGCYLECDYMACCDEYEQLCQEYYHLHRKQEQIPEDFFIHIDIPLTIPHQQELLKAAGFGDIQLLHYRKNAVILKAVKN